jgi:hypothetical protein
MANGAQEQSVILTPKQARAVLALQFEREEIARRANEQINEIMEAFQDQGAMLAVIHQLPRGEDWVYAFESVTDEGQPRIKLTAKPAEAEPAEAEAPEEGDDEQ